MVIYISIYLPIHMEEKFTLEIQLFFPKKPCFSKQKTLRHYLSTRGTFNSTRGTFNSTRRGPNVTHNLSYVTPNLSYVTPNLSYVTQ